MYILLLQVCNESRNITAWSGAVAAGTVGVKVILQSTESRDEGRSMFVRKSRVPPVEKKRASKFLIGRICQYNYNVSCSLPQFAGYFCLLCFDNFRAIVKSFFSQFDAPIFLQVWFLYLRKGCWWQSNRKVEEARTWISLLPRRHQ